MTHGKEVPADVLQIDTELEILKKSIYFNLSWVHQFTKDTSG
jgi:serine protease inhibitor